MIFQQPRRFTNYHMGGAYGIQNNEHSVSNKVSCTSIYLKYVRFRSSALILHFIETKFQRITSSC